MNKRDEELPFYAKHKTPEEVAMYFRRRRIGRNYDTYGQLWDASEDVVQTGLLHLILDRLDDITRDPLKEHVEWLASLRYREAKEVLLEEFWTEHRLLEQLFGDCLFEVHCEDIYPDWDIHDLSEIHRGVGDHYVSYAKAIRILQGKIDRMKSVKRRNQASRLKGIGKKRAEMLSGKAAAK